MYLDVPEEFKPLILAQATWTCEISRLGHFDELPSCGVWGKRNVPTRTHFRVCAVSKYIPTSTPKLSTHICFVLLKDDRTVAKGGR